MSVGMKLHFLVLLLSLAFLSPLQAADENLEQERIRQRVEQIRSGTGLEIEGNQISSRLVLPALYEQRDYTLVWTRQESVNQLFNVLENIDEDGLSPADYHLDKLRELRSRIENAHSSDTGIAADYDILLTDSLIRLGYHLLVGKVDPVQLDSNWNMDQAIGSLDMILQMAQSIDTAMVTELVESLRPQLPVYAALKAALMRYRQIEQQGGWPSVPEGVVLKRGMSDPRVTDIRKRLAVTGELPAAELGSTLYDEAVEMAVELFQRHHNLAADGATGAATLAAMNVPVEDRIDQIRVNLERARWVFHNLSDEFVLVDIAGFQVLYFRGGKLIWRTRAQVGTPFRKTPVFKSRITFLEINPTWTVPPTILNKDILPKLWGDPAYLQKRDMQVIQYNGTPVDASTIDWSLYPGKDFPYLIRQNPGPRNALGRIKFMFPNEHLVYLHDTPSKSLFERSERTFSSGCIRIENPYSFAELLLKSDEWDTEKIVEVVDSKIKISVSLPSPVTVILLYWTVNAETDEHIVFKKDIYNRDAAILVGLKQPFKFRKNPIINPDEKTKSSNKSNQMK